MGNTPVIKNNEIHNNISSYKDFVIFCQNNISYEGFYGKYKYIVHAKDKCSAYDITQIIKLLKRSYHGDAPHKMFAEHISRVIVEICINSTQDLFKFSEVFAEYQQIYDIQNRQNYPTIFFQFNVDVKDSKFEIIHLHNPILFCKKNSDDCGGFIINIRNGDLERIKPYVISVIDEKLVIKCNGQTVNTIIQKGKESIGFGKLPPTFYIKNEDDLSFLQQPLDIKIWDKIKDFNNIINAETFKSFEYDRLQAAQVQRFWPYLRVCQKFLFEDFDDNLSERYTYWRQRVFLSSQFSKFVSMMPFLSLLLFAYYDGFYRDNLLAAAKEYYQTNKLKDEDILTVFQSGQTREKYDIYKKHKETDDIKNLVQTPDDKDNILHQTVVSEIFECVSITEGLLQIIENACLHAGGGLLSMRIYSRAKKSISKEFQKQDHVDYLNNKYSEKYFEYCNSGGKKNDYYLEVCLSDLSDKSIPDKFCENYTTGVDDSDNEELMKVCELLTKNRKYIDLKYFFAPTNSQRSIKKTFYNSMLENIVHHYGLDIFNTILTARNGIFSVCGYTEVYDNLEDVFGKVFAADKHSVENISQDFRTEFLKIIEKVENGSIAKVRTGILKNEHLEGTTYNILLPLSHAIDTVKTNREGVSMLQDYKLSSTFEAVYVDSAKVVAGISKTRSITQRRSNVEKICQNIIKEVGGIDKQNQVLCLDILHQIDGGGQRDCDFFEEIIKGVLLFVLKSGTQLAKTISKQDNPEIILPVAITNLSPFQFIEAARLIATYYTKEWEQSDVNLPAVQFQFYLKSVDIGKEIIFAGKDVAEVCDNITKSAMTNGSMTSEIITILQILQDVVTREQCNE